MGNKFLHISNHPPKCKSQPHSDTVKLPRERVRPGTAIQLFADKGSVDLQTEKLSHIIGRNENLYTHWERQQEVSETTVQPPVPPGIPTLGMPAKPRKLGP